METTRAPERSAATPASVATSPSRGSWYLAGAAAIAAAATIVAALIDEASLPPAPAWTWVAVFGGLLTATTAQAVVGDAIRRRPVTFAAFPLAIGLVFLAPATLLALDLVAAVAVTLALVGRRPAVAARSITTQVTATAVAVAVHRLAVGADVTSSDRGWIALGLALAFAGISHAVVRSLVDRSETDASAGEEAPSLWLVGEVCLWAIGAALGAVTANLVWADNPAAWAGGAGFGALVGGGLLSALALTNSRLDEALTRLHETMSSSVDGDVAEEVAPLLRDVLDARAVIVVDGPDGAAFALDAGEETSEPVTEAMESFIDDVQLQSGALTVHIAKLRVALERIGGSAGALRWAHIACASGFTGAVVAIGREPLLATSTRQRFLDRAAAGIGMGAAASRRLATFERRARFDSLTGLPSRAHIEERIECALAKAQEDDRHAVVLVDLNGFKEVNDTLGHQIGDVVLAEIGRRIGSFADRAAAVGRLGGDEFVILLESRDGDLRAHVEALTSDLADAIAEPIAHGDLVLDLSISAGAAHTPEHGTTADDLIRSADVAMYAAKSRGERLRTYEGSLDRHRSRRLGLATDLRVALAAQDLRVVFQPKVAFATGELVGAEALIRWSHPTLGFMPAGEIISIAEHAGILREITDYVMDRAGQLAAAMHAEGIDLTIAVNLTERDIADPALPDRVSAVLERYDLTAEHLSLEVTETALLTQEVEALGVLPKLADLGLGLAIDDFGTGFSSLSHLRRFPVDEIKIDMSFVERIVIRPNDAVIVRSIVQLGHSLGMRVVAEGVETSEAWATLAGFGTDVAQGNHVMRAIDPDSFRSWAAFWICERIDRNSVGAAPELPPGAFEVVADEFDESADAGGEQEQLRVIHSG